MGSDWRRAGWVLQHLVEPCERGDFRLFTLGLFKSSRVSVGGGDRGEVLSMCALSALSDFPDPTIGSNGLPNWFGVSQQAPAYKAADQACMHDLPNIRPQTAAEKAAANRAAVKYAICMRSNGVPDFPGPNGQGLIQINHATGVLKSSSPQFQKAQTACKSLDRDGFGQVSSTAVSAPPGGAGSGS